MIDCTGREQYGSDGRSRRQFLADAVIAGTLFPLLSVQAEETSPAPFPGLTAKESQAIREAVDEFMAKHTVPGLSLAITRNGRLLLAEGFGVANVETDEPVTPQHLFRIASVSKPITSVAIMKLIENGKVSLDDRVFGEGGQLSHLYNPRTVRLQAHRARLEAVTVQNLLEHTCGGWGNQKNDPMFAWDAIKFDHDALIRWVLAHRPLDHDPGTKYDYSNFGFCLLSRIIEAVSGDDYETHVREQVLIPSGATSTWLALEEISARLPGEVEYVGQDDDPNHAVMRVRRMDGHGGWVSSAIDLVRFVNHVDGFPKPPDLLQPETIRTMTQPSAANAGYAKGWSVNKHHNWWHIGSFNGAASVIVRTHHGFCWAMLLNTRGKQKDFTTDLDKLPWTILSAIRQWPDHDLF